jgi:fumarate hydratase class II
LVEAGLGIATALAPRLGYDAAAKIAYEAAASGETILQAASRLTDLTQEDLRRLLDPSRLVEIGLG